MDQRVPPQHRRPSGARSRPTQPPQVTDLEGPCREASAGLRHHRGRQVDPRGVGAATSQVRRDVTRTRPELHDRLPAAWSTTRSSSQVSNGSPPARRRGARHRSSDVVVRRPDPLVAHLRSFGDHRVPIDRPSNRSLLRDRAEEVDPSGILLTGSPLQHPHQWFRALRHTAQARLDLTPVGEAVQSFCPGAQLTGRLLAPEQQHRQERPFLGLEPEVLVEDLVILQRSSTGRRPHDPQQSAILQGARGLLDDLQVQVHDGVAIVRLVARGDNAFAVRGYDAGTVVCFSSRLPRMR